MNALSVWPPRIIAPAVACGLRFRPVLVPEPAAPRWPPLARLPPPAVRRVTTRPERSLPSISDVYLIDPGGAPSQPPPANEIDAPREEEVLELDDGDFCEVYSEEPDLGVDVDVDFDLEATYALPPPVRYEPTTARYLVSMGEGRGQLSLRALAPGEPPPFGEPIAMLSPSCSVDTRTIEAMLNR